MKKTTIRCNRCDEIIDPKKAKWLELSQTDGNFYTEKFPKNHNSQGSFSFGTTCATREIYETIESLKTNARSS